VTVEVDPPEAGDDQEAEPGSDGRAKRELGRRSAQGDGDDRLAQDDQGEESPAFRDVTGAGRNPPVERDRDGRQAEIDGEGGTPEDVTRRLRQGERNEPKGDGQGVAAAVPADQRSSLGRRPARRARSG
jgi:hypothetical protein